MVSICKSFKDSSARNKHSVMTIISLTVWFGFFHGVEKIMLDVSSVVSDETLHILVIILCATSSCLCP